MGEQGQQTIGTMLASFVLPIQKTTDLIWFQKDTIQTLLYNHKKLIILLCGNIAEDAIKL